MKRILATTIIAMLAFMGGSVTGWHLKAQKPQNSRVSLTGTKEEAYLRELDSAIVQAATLGSLLEYSRLDSDQKPLRLRNLQAVLRRAQSQFKVKNDGRYHLAEETITAEYDEVDRTLQLLSHPSFFDDDQTAEIIQTMVIGKLGNIRSLHPSVDFVDN